MKKLLLTLSLGLLLTTNVWAQDNRYQTIDVHKDYILSPTPKSMLSKPVVIEFFWYGCSHCYQVEPYFTNYMLNNHNKILFKRYPAIPVSRWANGAKLFFTLEEMQLVGKLHAKVFKAIQDDKINLMDDANQRKEFFKNNGVNPERAEAIFNSFSMNAKIAKANKVTQSYFITSTPSIVVNNQYVTNPGLSGGYEETVKMIDILLKK